MRSPQLVKEASHGTEKKVRTRVIDWFIALLCTVAGVTLFYVLLITGAMPWYLMLMDAAEGTFWARFLSSGVPAGIGSLAGTLYLNAARKRMEKAAEKEDPR